MNETQRALYRQLSAMLETQAWPDGRRLTEWQWWRTLEVAEAIALGPLPSWSHGAHTDAELSSLSSPGQRRQLSV